MQYRLYAFVNYYLSSIQQGIQTGHAAVDMVRKYAADLPHSPNQKMMAEWADNHKTFITLNGGNSGSLRMIKQVVSASAYPWVTFSEDEESLGGIMTTVAVIVPENIYDARRVVDSVVDPAPAYSWQEPGDVFNMTTLSYFPGTPDYDLITVLKSCRLAA